MGCDWLGFEWAWAGLWPGWAWAVSFGWALVLGWACQWAGLGLGMGWAGVGLGLGSG